MEEEFRIKDEASGPVHAMTEALHGLTEALKSSAGASEKAEYGYGKLGKAAKEAGEASKKHGEGGGGMGGMLSSMIPELAAAEVAVEIVHRLRLRRVWTTEENGERASEGLDVVGYVAECLPYDGRDLGLATEPGERGA